MSVQSHPFAKQIDLWFEAHRAELIRDLIRIVNIKSVSDAESSVKPFGQGCRDVLEEMLRLESAQGFLTKNYDNYVGCIQFGESAEDIGVWCHLDVVPEGTGWNYAPYDAVEKDGYVIGRGAQDNKGPAVGMLYVLQCLRDLHIPLRHSIKLFYGTNEERGMADLDYFVQHYPCPSFNLVPDSGFPVCYGERGALDATLTADRPLSPQILSLRAGTVPTTVPDFAEIILQNSPEREASVQHLPADFTVSISGEQLTIQAHGVSSHAMDPNNQTNAIRLLTGMLLEHNLLSPPDAEIFRFFDAINQDTCGTSLGLSCTDDISGPLICAGTMLHLTPDRHASIQISCKFPVTVTLEPLLERLEQTCRTAGFSVTLNRGQNPNHFDKSHPAVQQLTQVYNEMTGSSAEPFIMSGGTYARKLPHAVAFGTGLPTKPLPAHLFEKGHGDFHQPDEAMDLERLFTSMKIYTISLLTIDSLSFTNSPPPQTNGEKTNAQ